MYEEVLERLRSYTKHEEIIFTNRCNTAIFLALNYIKKINPKGILLIPDQGGWVTYKTYPKFLGISYKEIPTDDGLIKTNTLNNYLENASAIIFNSFAGYFAEQPVQEIAKICHKRGCLVIEDASGSLTDSILADGNYSDIIVASFGKWKLINVGYGGMLSTNDKELLEKISDIKTINSYPPYLPEHLFPLLNDTRRRFLLDLSRKVKKDLNEYKIFHRDKRGLNVVTENNPFIIDYCNQNNYEYLICPKYIRINRPAISIELKRRE